MGYTICLNYIPSWQRSVIRDDNDQEHYLGRRCHQEGLNTGPMCLLFLSEPGREGADRDGVQLAQGGDPPGLYWHRKLHQSTDKSPNIGRAPFLSNAPEQAGRSCPYSHRSEPWIGKQRKLMFGLKVEKAICILKQVGSKTTGKLTKPFCVLDTLKWKHINHIY